MGILQRCPRRFWRNKNKQSIRKISVDEYTLEVFKDYFEKTEIEEENKHELAFFNKASNKYKVISNFYANRILRNLLKILDIQPIISMHGIRHTHASLLLYRKDISVNYISERLGYGSVTTTLRKYAHVIRELRDEDEASSKEVISKLFEKRFGSPEKD